MKVSHLSTLLSALVTVYILVKMHIDYLMLTNAHDFYSFGSYSQLCFVQGTVI